MHFYFIVNDDVNDVGRHTIPLPLVVAVAAAVVAPRCGHCTKVTRLGSSCGSSAAQVKFWATRWVMG